MKCSASLLPKDFPALSLCAGLSKAERRYAGVTMAANDLNDGQVAEIKDKVVERGLSISGLGYYPNPLCSDRDEAQVYIDHLGKVIDASAKLGVNVMNTFIGRDPAKSIDDNWPCFLEVWKPLVSRAEDKGVRIGIENCPMYFSSDEWPSGRSGQSGRVAKDVRRYSAIHRRTTILSFALATNGLPKADKAVL